MAPGGPEIENHDVALKTRERQFLSIEAGESEIHGISNAGIRIECAEPGTPLLEKPGGTIVGGEYYIPHACFGTVNLAIYLAQALAISTSIRIGGP